MLIIGVVQCLCGRNKFRMCCSLLWSIDFICMPTSVVCYSHALEILFLECYVVYFIAVFCVDYLIPAVSVSLRRKN